MKTEMKNDGAAVVMEAESQGDAFTLGQIHQRLERGSVRHWWSDDVPSRIVRLGIDLVNIPKAFSLFLG